MISLSINIDNVLYSSICDSARTIEVLTIARNSITTLDFTGIPEDIILKISRGKYVTIDDVTDKMPMRLCAGVIEEIKAVVVNQSIVITLRIRDFSWKKMEEKSFKGFLSGELQSVIKSLVSDLGINVLKEYEGSISIQEYKDGFVDEIIRDILDKNGIPWNVQRDRLILGKVSSGFPKPPKLVNKFSGLLRNDYGSIDVICAEIVATDLLFAGDNVLIGNINYIIVRSERVVIRSLQERYNSYNIVCCQDIDSVMKAAIYYDEEEEIRQIALFYKESIRVNHLLHRLEFLWSGTEWVGEIVNYTFEGTSISPGAYLKIGGISCSATVGYHIGKDMKIVGINASLVKTIVPTYDDGYIEICRNGIAIGNVKFKEVGLSKDLNINFAGGGVLSLRNKNDVNFPTLNSIIAEIRARELINE